MIFNSAHTGPHLERANGRNGYRERLWEAHAGSVGLTHIQGVSTRCSLGLVRWSSGNC
jgi:hypothetical protein